ncbi:hypothetical protein GCM10023100_69070 [Actinocorallia cavernae]|uniref:Uncharacterized protein n=2 Tax=Actinomycetes TaxID=1760 RepID=A0ABP8T870_9ACTN
MATLEELGPAGVPREDPLTYPGAWPARSGLLHGDRMLPLTRLVYDDRAPVLAVGSHACPVNCATRWPGSGSTRPSRWCAPG